MCSCGCVYARALLASHGAFVGVDCARRAIAAQLFDGLYKFLTRPYLLDAVIMQI